MDYIETPHLIVLNATTSEHHIPDDDPMEMTIDAIREFLDSIAEQRAKVTYISRNNVTIVNDNNFIFLRLSAEHRYGPGCIVCSLKLVIRWLKCGAVILY